jgi:RimJ/RimL family protein N-acetyltransferase
MARSVPRRIRSLRVRYRIEWSTPAGDLVALEPRGEEVTAHAGELAAAYNDPRNAPLLGHSEPIDADEVVEHYESMREDGARPFLLYRDGALAGDGDLRKLGSGAAEFAFLVASPSAQGKGLGTRFALMIHAFAFRSLGLRRVYASIVPENIASRRVFEKLGYALDDSPEAAPYADEPGDLVMVIDRERFETLHAEALGAIRIAKRSE